MRPMLYQRHRQGMLVHIECFQPPALEQAGGQEGQPEAGAGGAPQPAQPQMKVIKPGLRFNVYTEPPVTPAPQ